MNGKFNNTDIVKKIKDTLIFNDVDENKIEKILNKINYKIINLKKEENFAFRDDEVKGLYIVILGKLFAEMSSDNGGVKKIEDLEPRSIIASAFIFGKSNKFPVDVFAKEDSLIFFVEKKEFLKMLQLDLKIMENTLNLISQKAQFLSQKVWQGVNYKTIKEKLANYILKNMDKNEIEFRPSINEVANSFGIRRPSLSRILSSFVEDGILERKGRKFIIKDIKKLKIIK